MDIPDFKQFKVHIPETGNYFDVLQALRGYYAYNHDRIIAHHEKGSMGHYVSYPCDWRSVMSPIEFEAWSAIRCKGRIPLYPQFPAGKYFLDFGNPYFKIGLELDGKGYHEKAKDLHRDEELHELGWKIFRITGSEMVKSNFEDGNSLFDSSDYYEQENDFQKLKDWIFNTGDGIIEALKVQYFGGGIHMPEQFHDRFRAWCNHSLNNHTLIPE